MDVRDADRSRRVVCLRQFFQFSKQARKGTCCRKAIRTTKPYISAFRLGATIKLCVECCQMSPTNFATKARWIKRNASSIRRS